jgi:hypothetical protein
VADGRATRMTLGRSADNQCDRGSGTKASGYIEHGAPTFCGNCLYVAPYSQKRGECREEHVKKDPEVKKRNGNGDVSLTTGCCSFWDPQLA